jgi:uncharacterized 2Fe-2S/4Fe-4S cluster protein (DUF4445 family)
MPAEPDFTVNFQPVGRRVSIPQHQSLLEAAQESGIEIASVCGGAGICNSCKVRLSKGSLSPVTQEEEGIFTQAEIEAGFRLACQAYPLSNLTIEIPPESLSAPQRLQIEGQSKVEQIDPLVVPVEIEIPAPTISDLRSDQTRVRDALVHQGFTQPVNFTEPVLEEISPSLRRAQWQVTLAMRMNSIVAILPPSARLLGLAVDVGTTKLAAYLCNLSTGVILAQAGAMNPQTAFGEDVISRISYTNTHPEGRKLLQGRLMETLNQLIEGLCRSAGRSDQSMTTGQIVEAVVVGNTAMHHLFGGLPVTQLGISPYIPAVSDALEIAAIRVGLKIASGANIYLPPNIAGYVGADHVAMLLSTGVWESPKTAIALDIGTNTEISLVHNHQIIACSCASGPAFEGAHIQAGMRAAPGAIERVEMIQGELRTQTIDNLAATGICGSGILDAIACMRRVGALDHRGSLNPEFPTVRQSGSTREFLLVDHSRTGTGKDLVITRKDVNEIQLAKGAIRAGIDVLLEVSGIPTEAIEEFIIAGAFGTYINIPSAVHIGMFPSLPLNRFRQVGNAAGAGARQMLLSGQQRRIAQGFASQVKYIELSNYPNFTPIFSRSLFL